MGAHRSNSKGSFVNKCKQNIITISLKNCIINFFLYYVMFLKDSAQKFIEFTL